MSTSTPDPNDASSKPFDDANASAEDGAGDASPGAKDAPFGDAPFEESSRESSFGASSFGASPFDRDFQENVDRSSPSSGSDAGFALEMGRMWVRDNLTTSMLGAFAAGVFLGALLRD